MFIFYIGNDSGPMHMAAAVETPVVEISCHPETAPPEHANAPERYYPLVSPHRVVRPQHFENPCGYACIAKEPHCILANTIEAVLDASLEVLATSGNAGAVSSFQGVDEITC